MRWCEQTSQGSAHGNVEKRWGNVRILCQCTILYSGFLLQKDGLRSEGMLGVWKKKDTLKGTLEKN